MPVRIATFNVENLLSRFSFEQELDALRREGALNLLEIPDKQTFIDLEMARRVVMTDDARQSTALAIRDTHADIVCLQEVESLKVLRDFEKFYLHHLANLDYPWKRLIEGNDARGIDVAALAKRDYPIMARSHAGLTFDDLGVYDHDLNLAGINRSDRVFRRDCLELDTRVDGRPLTIYVCHFKSMGFRREPGIPYGTNDPRDITMPIRWAEATAVRRIIEDRFGKDGAARANWVICGDLNDHVYKEGNKVSPTGVDPLLNGGFSVNLIERLQPGERWTHYYPKDNHRTQLDYILVSPALAAANPDAKPEIVRSGMPFRVPGTDGIARYPRTGWARPKASDHCPMAVTLSMA
ncbi:endonuclease/exonuclease/phosphatase family protein [Rhodobium gokarnense]|uniref:Endonuclease/exonuclease/phosphatase family metal-dependent hydrolase n=1 Tax=Rhodobium gokarnense TaxID=364296 RepID=A0ABT3H9B9_9HYPH|nr:endonuclease/exonuclease/phosphatase family protein [Rhodobium gokarnense]MCW2306981.1 endonuclease/exonuclease/phosphatase family metal-dependent hydrolase [Rhodobium gokarnense]